MGSDYRQSAPQQSHQPGREQLMQPPLIAMRADYRGSDKLKNKVAFISGGDSGIGRAVALHFDGEGADIAILYLDEDDDAAAAAHLFLFNAG